MARSGHGVCALSLLPRLPSYGTKLARQAPRRFAPACRRGATRFCDGRRETLATEEEQKPSVEKMGLE
jgi:hypothetical protein